MARFKVGDRVRGLGADIEGCEGVIEHIVEGHQFIRFTKMGTESWQSGGEWRVGGLLTRPIDWSDYLVLLDLSGKATEEPVRFILQYELDEDPFETFATMKEVEERIRELAKRSDLKRESIKVYEIAKTYDVGLETRIVFGPKVTLTAAPKKEQPLKRKKRTYVKSGKYSKKVKK